LLNKLLTILLTIFCVVFLIFGQMYWKEKTQQATATTTEEGTNASTTNDKDVDDAGTDSISLLTDEKMKDSIQNLPDKVQSTILSAHENGESVSMLIIGSTALGNEENGWASLFRDKLQSVYGEDFFRIDIFGFDGNSNEFITSWPDEELSEQSYDLVLLEGFTWEDNGEVSISNNHDNLLKFRDMYEDAVVMLQPPHPIYQAINYPIQVEDLKVFAEENEIPYIDHWSEWPDAQTDEILPYVTEEDELTEDGSALWADSLGKVFIRE
jgi:hypothetical protein